MKSIVAMAFFLLAVVGVISASPFIPSAYNPSEFHRSRIVGGTPAEEGSAPYMVGLVHGLLMRFLICGGSLVAPNCVVTAAHCTEAMMWNRTHLLESARGTIGSNRWDQDNEIHFKSFVNHPDYDRVLIKNDVSLLFTRVDVVPSDRVNFIPLRWEWVGGNEEGYVTGWGMTEVWSPTPETLQYLEVRTTTGQQCIDAVAEGSLQWGYAPPIEPAVELCAIHSYGHGACMGDSGSALVHKETGGMMGIVSWGFACALGIPDMYARVSGFQDFINSHLLKN